MSAPTTALLYFEEPLGRRPPVDQTADSEEFVLRMINSGRTVVALWHAIGDIAYMEQGKILVPHFAEPSSPNWTDESAFYDVITDILQAATANGFDAEQLCQQALANQRGLLAEAREMANDLRGEPR